MITDSVWIGEFCGGHVKLFLPAKFVIKEFPSV
jgi:hypothetical protein